MLTDGAKNIRLLLTAGVGNDYAVAWGVSHAMLYPPWVAVCKTIRDNIVFFIAL